MARSSTSLSSLRQQVRALKNRVTWLERALKPAKKPISPDVNIARDHAEQSARDEALMEYYREWNIAFYKRHPDWLERERAEERNRNAFLRSRGIEPEPSRIPEEK